MSPLLGHKPGIASSVPALVACVLAASPLDSAQGSTAAVSAPVLKWSYGGCISGPYCDTGWYSSPAVADLDGDGSSEVVWGAYDVVALQGSSGSLRWRAESGQRVWPGVAVADLTGDGTLEVVVGRSGDQVTVYDRFGSAVWTRNPFGGGEVRTLAVADLETDGALEIVVGRAGVGATRQLNVLEPNGAVRAGWPARRDGEAGYGWGMYNENVAVADMNGDGLKEIFGPTDTHYITALDRGGNQLAASSVYGAGKVWSQVGVHVDHAVDLRGYANCGVEHRPNFADSAPIVADVNADGVPEMIVVGNVYDCGTDPYTSLYQMPFILKLDRTRWSGSGFDWTSIPVPGPGSGPRSEDYGVIETALPNAAAADLDGDGRLEILFPSYDGKLHAYWLDKTEHGSWPYTVPATGSGGDTFRFASEPVVADLDGDGQAEVIFASWPKKATGRTGHLHVLSSLGVELWRVSLPAPAIGKTWNGGLGAPTLANVDADADLEVVVGTAASGVAAFDLPGSAGARVLWRTGRGGYRRTGTTELASVTVDDVQVTEGNGGTTRAVFDIHVSGGGDQPVSVAFATADGTASGEADYGPTSGSFGVPAGPTTVHVELPIAGDLLDEANETFFLNLQTTGAVLVDGQGRCTILDDDAPPVLSIDDASVAEGETGTSLATFTLSLSAPSGRTVGVTAATADGTATTPSDYDATSLAVLFAPGATTAEVSVPVRGDRVWEADETFAVSLSAPVNATLADVQGAGTIRNDDPQGISITDLDVVEPVAGTRIAVFTVTLSPPSASPATVSYSTSALTATPGADYDDVSGTLAFDPGATTQTVAIPIHADAATEPVETFRLDLSTAVGAAIAHGQATGRIHDPGNYFSVTPCRVLDTRSPSGDYGGPALAAGQSRAFTLAGRCGVPASATAVAVNLTVTQATSQGNLRLYPAGGPAPSTSTLNYAAGQTRANNAVVGLSPGGALAIRCNQGSGTAHAILDVTGYFE
jgi:hypothetical protein